MSGVQRLLPKNGWSQQQRRWNRHGNGWCWQHWRFHGIPSIGRVGVWLLQAGRADLVEANAARDISQENARAMLRIDIAYLQRDGIQSITKQDAI